ncbi:MAG TPA: response regulator [Puia sp.]|jgi:DNA-binding response OmpR family regulator|nr:response regulator [Puia sp.]
MSAYNIYIVEDDPWYGEILESHLGLNPDFKVTRFQTAKDCLSKMHLEPDLVTLDFSLPDKAGDMLFEKIREINPKLNNNEVKRTAAVLDIGVSTIYKMIQQKEIIL